ncbi:MAG: 3'-5' exonuclease [Ferruginibacter sp.]|nr:3'-5' exonuclease [Ferruginibacter sp.]
MNEYLLFIDTEASGLPKKWYLPYTAPGNWPYAVQVSWLIYSKSGEKISEQNYYISNNDFEICSTALRIHGLTKDFLKQNGIPRKQLLSILSKDLLEFQPMIVGHFAELDYHIIGADYCREGMDNPMEKLPVFCIMIASRHLQQNPQSKFLRLGELYALLFKQPLLNQHNAMIDAAATAACFFELVKINEISSFIQPPIVFQEKEKLPGGLGWIIAFLLVILIALLITCYYG